MVKFANLQSTVLPPEATHLVASFSNQRQLQNYRIASEK